MWTKSFWKQTSERAIKTFAQALAAFISIDVIGILDVNWTLGFSTAALAALLSVLTSVGSAGIGPESSPSAVSVTKDYEGPKTL